MEKNYFEIISENVNEGIKNRGFECIKTSDEYLFKKDDVIYKIVCRENKSIICLENAGTDGEYKIKSSWCLKKDEFLQKDVEMISEDFIHSIVGMDKSFKKQSRTKNEEESNIDSLFFANRMANILPELKEEIRIEKECYSEFRGVTFAREQLVPRLKNILSSGKDKAKLQKLFKVMSELYQNGTLDVRSIITMVILNSIEEEKQIRLVEDLIDEKLKSAWSASRKYKGKKVKPEKVKK